ncbi:MAG: MCE family protein [Solirubrobacterales bacterium]|nr:MCE family protein [Solirubrobacterales bacterium]
MRSPFRRSANRRHPSEPGPDERIWGRHYTGVRPWVFGLLIAILLAIGVYLAFAKEIPFTGPGYQVSATFENATTLRATNPVRIAGVNVGEVQSIERDGDAAKVAFTVDDAGRPIHTDAEIEIRPRLFLEGNFFLDLDPGSPSAPELPDGGQIPITQTATAVQLDEVLTALQAPERRGLQRLLEGYGTALTYEPTPADDADQDPIVRGESAAESLNDAFRYGGPAGRGTAIVNTALLGEHPHDLSGFIRGFSQVFTKLADREQDLSDLITNFNVFTGALAAESANLADTFSELAPTLEEAQPSLAHLSDALPPLRALVIELRPGVQELPATIAAGNPWLDQSRRLLADSELGGLARLLRNTAPGLAEAADSTKTLFNQQTQLARCTSRVLVPTGDLVVRDRFATGEPNFNEFFYGITSFAGSAQGFDGNGPYLRFQSGGGPTLVKGNNPSGPASGLSSQTFNFANLIEQPAGIQPFQPAKPPPFRMELPCARNPVPNVNGPAGAVAPSDLTAVTP